MSLAPIERARRYLAQVAPAVSGQGGNKQTWDAMLAVAGFALAPDEAWQVALEYNARCVPPWPERALARKLDEAHRAKVPAGRLLGNGAASRVPWTSPAPAKPAPVAPVEMPAPVPVPDAHLSPSDALRRLFSAGDLLRVVREARQDEDGKWKPASKGRLMERDELCGLLDRGELGENPDAGAWLGINPQADGTATDAGVSSFRHLLLESDDGTPGQQLAVILATGLPVSAVVDSAGKSLHAWVRVDAPTLDEYRRRVAVVYSLPLLRGFDPQNKNPGRLTRLPGAMRGGRAQRVVALGLGAASWDEWEASRPAEPEPADEPAPWPFDCLGYNEGHAFLLPLDTRQVEALKLDKLTSKAALMGIHGDGGWWAANFPDDNGGADWSRAGLEIRQRCTRAGVYDPAALGFRGRGVWLDAGCVVANLGGRVLTVDGKPVGEDWRSPSGHRYLPGVPLPVAPEPLDDETARAFVALLEASLRDRGAAQLLGGFVLNGFVLGTMEARPSLWISGEKGAGKTYAQELVKSALGGFALAVSAGTTEAGLRQAVGKGDALPILYDEAEADDERGKDRMREILSFLRAGYNGDGQVIQKGGQNGTGTAYRARSCGLLASIHPALERARDGSRFALLELKSCPPDERARRNEACARLRAQTVDAPGFAAKLAARAVALAGVRLRNAARLAASLDRLGDDRAQRKWGELLAGAVAMEHGRELSQDEANAIARGFDPSPYSGDTEQDAEGLLRRILTSSIDCGEGERRTVAQVLVDAMPAPMEPAGEPSASDEALSRVGLGWADDGSLKVATGHAGLLALLRDEPWRGDGRRVARELATLPGAKAKPGKGLRLGRTYHGAGVAIPKDTLAGFIPKLDEPF